jgi:hypothetical protein
LPGALPNETATLKRLLFASKCPAMLDAIDSSFER